MPITKELDNINELEAVGFGHNQAKALARIIEKSHVDSQQDLKEFIRNELKDLRNIDIAKLTNKIDSDIKELKISFLESHKAILESQKDLLLKFIGIISAIIGVAVAIIKLF